MIVFIAGMQRSGSTYSFNIARDILRKRGSVFQEASQDVLGALRKSVGTDHILLKAHTADETILRLVESGAVKAICTARRPEDAIASWMETFAFNLEDCLEQMRAWLAMFERLKNYALVVRYQDIERRPLLSAYRIARHLRAGALPLEIYRVARNYSKAKVKVLSDNLDVNDTGVMNIGFSHYDKTTFFHRRHVSSLTAKQAGERIGLEAVSRIRRELKLFINDDGNLRSVAL
jgi:hypothetical protein